MYRRIIFSTTIIVGLTMGLMLVSCGGSESTSSPEPSTPTTPAAPEIDAAAIYSSTCLACHGPNREGLEGLGKPLTPDALASRSDAEIRETITNGVSETAMMPFEETLDSAQIDAIVQFIKNIKP